MAKIHQETWKLQSKTKWHRCFMEHKYIIQVDRTLRFPVRGRTSGIVRCSRRSELVSCCRSASTTPPTSAARGRSRPERRHPSSPLYRALHKHLPEHSCEARNIYNKVRNSSGNNGVRKKFEISFNSGVDIQGEYGDDVHCTPPVRKIHNFLCT